MAASAAISAPGSPSALTQNSQKPTLHVTTKTNDASADLNNNMGKIINHSSKPIGTRLRVENKESSSVDDRIKEVEKKTHFNREPRVSGTSSLSINYKQGNHQKKQEHSKQNQEAISDKSSSSISASSSSTSTSGSSTSSTPPPSSMPHSSSSSNSVVFRGICRMCVEGVYYLGEYSVY